MNGIAMSNIGLCVIFNHPFAEQLPLLRDIYKSRFTNPLFLVPFETNHDEDVHTVYRGAFAFDGMIIEARKEIERRFSDCDYIAFVHNDLMLNPEINQDNMVDHFKLSEENAFIATCSKLNGNMDKWIWHYRLPYKIIWTMDTLLGTGAEKATNYFPSMETIAEKCIQAGFDPSASRLSRPSGENRPHYDYFISNEIYRLNNTPGGFDLKYPLFFGYSDIFIVKKSHFSEWVHMMGLLSALDVFEEISIPTSLVWTFGRVATQQSVGLNSTVLWGEERKQVNDINWALDRLVSGSYLHPMKLNSLNTDELRRIRSVYNI